MSIKKNVGLEFFDREKKVRPNITHHLLPTNNQKNSNNQSLVFVYSWRKHLVNPFRTMFHNKDRSSRHRSGSQILVATSQLPTAASSNKRTEAVFKIEDTLTKTRKSGLQDLLLPFPKVQNSSNNANNSTSSTSSSNSSSSGINNNVYTVYVIRVIKPYCKRSWLVLRRYSEFYDLHKYLTKQYEQLSGANIAPETTKSDFFPSKSNNGQRIEIPPIPPKLVFGNMKETNITKRLNGLQAFLNGISQQHDVFCEDPEVIGFFNLDKVCNSKCLLSF